MIEFRQKIFVVPLVGLAASTAAGIGISAVQTSKHHKQDAEQQEEFQRQQQAQQKKQNEALNRIAKAAEAGDMSKAQQAASIVQQKSYASIPLSSNSVRALAKLSHPFRKGGQSVYEFGKALNNTGNGNQIVKKIGHGLAMGTTMAAGGYLVDKAVQKDRENLTGGSLPQAQPDPQKKEKSIKKTVKTAALLGGTILAARKGALGKGFKNLSHGLNSAGNKIDKTSVLKNIGTEYKTGFKEQFVKDGKINTGGAALTTGFIAMPALSYIGERKQLKDQAAQERLYAENYQYQNETNRKKGSALKNLAIGGAATIGTIALARRAGPVKVRKYLNDMTMTYGKQIAGKNGNKVGNWMMKSGAEQYGKAIAAEQGKTITKTINSGRKAAAGGNFFDKHNINIFGKTIGRSKEELGRVASLGQAAEKANISRIDPKKAGELRLKAIQSGKAGRKFGEGALSKISSFWTGANDKQVGSFLQTVAKDNQNSKLTRDVAEKLGKHKRTALIGSIAVGSLAFKPFEWGDKVVRGSVGAVDKNAFAYEKSKEQQV